MCFTCPALFLACTSTETPRNWVCLRHWYELSAAAFECAHSSFGVSLAQETSWLQLHLLQSEGCSHSWILLPNVPAHGSWEPGLKPLQPCTARSCRGEVLPALCRAAPDLGYTARVTADGASAHSRAGGLLSAVSVRGHYKDGQLFSIWQKSTASCIPRKTQTCWKMRIIVCHQKCNGRVVHQTSVGSPRSFCFCFLVQAVLTLFLAWSLFVAPFQCKHKVRDRRHLATEAWNPSNILLFLYHCFLRQCSETPSTLDSRGPRHSAHRDKASLLPHLLLKMNRIVWK